MAGHGDAHEGMKHEEVNYGADIPNELLGYCQSSAARTGRTTFCAKPFSEVFSSGAVLPLCGLVSVVSELHETAKSFAQVLRASFPFAFPFQQLRGD
jgi:hypothetical protein